MLHGAQVIHAVVRRAVIEARGTEQLTASAANSASSIKGL
jgi:hypothetical protein